MGKLLAALSFHRFMRGLQEKWRRKHGKEPTQLPGERPENGTEVIDMLEILKGLFVGEKSQKAPMWGIFQTIYGLAALMGYQIPGVPPLSPEAAQTVIGTGLGILFLSFRVKKSGAVEK